MTYMRTTESDDRWDISRRPHTKTKLEILKKCFDVWFTIWSAPRQDWVSNEWYIIDLFAGRGTHTDEGQIVNGSPLIFLNTIARMTDRLKPNTTIKLFLVDYTRSVFDSLKENVDGFISDNPHIEDIVDLKLFNADCNEVIGAIVGQMRNSGKHPLFVLIDPWGIKIKKSTVEKIVGLRNPKDIMFNYMLEGVRRTSGIVIKTYFEEELSNKKTETVKTFMEFIGADVDIIDEHGRKIPDIKVLEEFCGLFTSQNLKVAAYDMKYPDRDDVLYYLLFASRNSSITDIIIDIYARQKESITQPSLFGREFDKDGIIRFVPRIREIEKK